MTLNAAPSATSFGTKARAVVPSDDADITDGPVKAVVCLTAGNVSVLPASSAVAVSFVDVPAGFVPPFQVRRVLSTGTTCTIMTIED